MGVFVCMLTHTIVCKGQGNFQELALSLDCGFGLTQHMWVVQQAHVLSEPSQHPQ